MHKRGLVRAGTTDVGIQIVEEWVVVNPLYAAFLKRSYTILAYLLY